MSDELFFAPEGSEAAGRGATGETSPWKVLVIDDEEEVHVVTRMVLGDMSFEGRRLDCISAYSAHEGFDMLRDNADVALVLLDVVMESNHAGLDLVHRIREDLGNTAVRIVLRTGQPGQAPEREVITRYDINDYKHKTELTAQRLFTTVVAALRGYRDLRIIERNRRGLERIIHASRDIFRLQSLPEFMAGVLTQLTSSLSEEPSSFYAGVSGLAAANGGGQGYRVYSATGRFAPCTESDSCDALDEATHKAIEKALATKESYFTDTSFVGYFRTPQGAESVFYVQDDRKINELDRSLIEIFAGNVSVALENIHLNLEIVDTQREVVLTLGEVVENRSHEAANHVRRVAEYAAFLARLVGMAQDEVEMLRIASPMHDVGKIGIPDSVLLKPGRLDEDEMAIMRTHAAIGERILSASKRPIMQAAAIVAGQHHERWDGTGYPRGSAGEDIHIYGRIVALADVFDALACRRVYKEPWPRENVVAYFREQAGKHFDPRLAGLLLEQMDGFYDILKAWPDTEE